jgi:MFS transporter, PAT family, beta-lactamase induction signal transducer AmpG
VAIAGVEAESVSFWSALVRDRRIAPAMCLGFTSGMPFLLTYSTQSAWLTDAGVPLATIGLLSELTLAYKFKFVWAPFLDQYDPPLIGKMLGRRRGWLIVAIVAVMVMLAGIASGDPSHWIWWTVGFSFALGVVGATLDLVLDGWRITSVRPPEKQAVLSSWTEIGYRVGNLAAGAGALYLADQLGWRGAYLCMAALMLVGIVATLFAPEPASDLTSRDAHIGIVKTIWVPVQDLLKRLGPMAVAILLLVAGFRMPGYISSAMAVPLFKHQGFSNTDIATVTKVFGFWIALGGTFLAGWLIPRIGMMSSLLIGTIAGSASHLALAFLAAHGGDGGKAFWIFAMAVGTEGFAYAFASIVLITYMSTLASTEYAASQFGLLTSLCAFPGSILAGFSGFVIEHTGFVWFFIWTSLIGVPVALLAVFVWYRVGISEEPLNPVAGTH